VRIIRDPEGASAPTCTATSARTRRCWPTTRLHEDAEGTKDPNRRKAWLLGRWDINIGAFLEGAWDPEKHIVKPFPIPSHWKVWQAMDWGYGKPYSVGWYAKDPEGKTYRFRELYGMRARTRTGKFLPNVGTKETPKTVAERIKAREEHDERLGSRCRCA
jgi:hypothetical protein